MAPKLVEGVSGIRTRHMERYQVDDVRWESSIKIENIFKRFHLIKSVKNKINDEVIKLSDLS